MSNTTHRLSELLELGSILNLPNVYYASRENVADSDPPPAYNPTHAPPAYSATPTSRSRLRASVTRFIQGVVRAMRLRGGAAIVAIVLSNGQHRPPDWEDFVGIVLLLSINSAIGFYEERNAGNAVKALMDSLLWHPRFDFPPFMVLIIALLNDGTIMTLSVDRVLPSMTPDSWDLGKVFAYAVVYGFYLSASTFFFTERPSTALRGAFCIAQLVSSIIAAYADCAFTKISAISGGWIGIVWVRNIIWFFPLELIKFAMNAAIIKKLRAPHEAQAFKATEAGGIPLTHTQSRAASIHESL
ncbi:hypothetical protein HWV62_2109 [Athelia sp. TMB]|nr:hypothetical protein HWV62_2109 [Athelia sp. TMB]